MLLTSKNSYNLLCISFSIILSNIERSDIGRKLFISCVELPLWIGITLTIFRNPGKVPSEKELLIKLHKGLTIKSGMVFNNFNGML